MATDTTAPVEGAEQETPVQTPEIAADPAEDYGAWEQQRRRELKGDEPEIAAPVAEPKQAPSEGAGDEPVSGSAEGADNSDDIKEQEKEGDKAKPGRKKNAVQERINELTRARREAEAHAKQLEERLAALERGDTKPAKAEPTAAAKTAIEQKAKDAGFTKTPADFDTYEEFVADLTRHVTREEIKAARSAETDERNRTQAEARNREVLDSWTAKLDAAREAHEDYDEVVEALETPITQPMQQALLDSEHGAEIAYYLAQHPEEADRISKLSPNAAVRSLGVIESRFTDGATSRKTESPAPKPKPVSKAPKPVKPIAGGSAGGVESIYDDSLAEDTTRWMRKRDAELRQRAA